MRLLTTTAILLALAGSALAGDYDEHWGYGGSYDRHQAEQRAKADAIASVGKTDIANAKVAADKAVKAARTAHKREGTKATAAALAAALRHQNTATNAWANAVKAAQSRGGSLSGYEFSVRGFDGGSFSSIADQARGSLQSNGAARDVDGRGPGGY